MNFRIKFKRYSGSVCWKFSLANMSDFNKGGSEQSSMREKGILSSYSFKPGI